MSETPAATILMPYLPYAAGAVYPTGSSGILLPSICYGWFSFLFSVFFSIKDVEVKVISEDGKELDIGELGELCIRSPNLMSGYLNRPEESITKKF